ncbi:MAG: AI-2E family transporter [Cyclobacteriaceae bacterium]
MKSSNIAYSLIIAIAIVVILVLGRSILQPLVLALLIWFLLKAVRNFVAKIRIKKKVLPSWIQNVVAFVLIFGVLTLVGRLLSGSVISLTKQLPAYRSNIVIISEQLNDMLNMDVGNWIRESFIDFDFTGILQKMLNAVYELFADAFLVILYVVFLIIEEAALPAKLKAMFPGQEQFARINGVLKRLNESIYNYIWLKTIVSLITGILSYFALLIIGVDSAFFWAFLIFLLNFIPTIGSLIATIFPALMSLLQTGSFTPFVLVLVCVGVIQLIVGNIIEPRMMGNSLNISSLIVLVALAFWGSIWGVVGMILSVPVTVMMIIIFAQFPKTRDIAIILSGDGIVK